MQNDSYDVDHKAFLMATSMVGLPFEEEIMEWKHILVVAILVVAVRRSEAADAMKLLATGFLKVLDECKKEVSNK